MKGQSLGKRLLEIYQENGNNAGFTARRITKEFSLPITQATVAKLFRKEAEDSN